MIISREWIRERRKALGLTQAELGEKVGANQSVVSQWEQGKAIPGGEVAVRLQQVLSAGQQSLLVTMDGAALTTPHDTTALAGTPPNPTPAEVSATEAPKRGRKKKVVVSEPAAGQESANGGATGGGEVERERLFKAADLLRSNIDPSEYKHYVLGLVFLKYIADVFVMRQAELLVEITRPESEYYAGDDPDPEDVQDILEREEAYTRAQVFWIPDEAFYAALMPADAWQALERLQGGARDAALAATRAELAEIRRGSTHERSLWTILRDRAPQPDIGQRLDNVLEVIERANDEEKRSLKGVLQRIYGGTALGSSSLPKLINLLSEIKFDDAGANARDTLGRVYEYFLGRFASQEGRGGGEFYTPSSVVRLLVEMLEPFEGRVYDPCCGSGGMFVQSARFVAEHGGERTDLSVYGQEKNRTTWRLCKMNLAIRSIDADIGSTCADTLHQDLHKDVRFDFVMANPPFNISEWDGELLQEDARWVYGRPPVGNANFAWIQHIVHHLKPSGVAGVVMANGSMSSQQSGEGEIRKALVEADRVECMVALPGQLFFTTQIPACLWILSKDKQRPHHKGALTKDRRGEVLFIDARKMGEMTDRTHRELTPADVQLIADMFHAWRGEPDAARPYADVPGFCKSATLEEVRKHQHVLTPGRYVGAQAQEDDGEPFEEKMRRLSGLLGQQLAQSAALEAAIRRNLDALGFGIPAESDQ